MKYSSAPGRMRVQVADACRSVYVGPARSMSTRLTQNRGLDAVAMTVIR